jgi:hypothetical protein
MRSAAVKETQVSGRHPYARPLISSKDMLVEDPSESLIRTYQEDDLRGDAMVLWMPFTPLGFLAKSTTVAPERDQMPLLPDAVHIILVTLFLARMLTTFKSNRRAPSPARDTAAGDKTPLFLPDDVCLKCTYPLVLGSDADILEVQHACFSTRG